MGAAGPTRLADFSGFVERERGRHWQVWYWRTFCSFFISWLGWPTTPVHQGLKISEDGRHSELCWESPQANWGRLVNVCLADLERMCSAYASTQVHVWLALWYVVSWAITHRRVSDPGSPGLEGLWAGQGGVRTQKRLSDPEESTAHFRWHLVSALIPVCVSVLCLSLCKMKQSVIWIIQAQLAIQWLNFSLQLLSNTELINVADVALIWSH